MQQCDWCEYECEEQERMNDHLVLCHNISACTMCDYKTLPKESIKRHMKQAHCRVKGRCDRCEFVYFRKGELELHEEKAHKKH